MNLIELDDKTIRDWGRLLDEIKEFIDAHVDTEENKTKLLELIFDYEIIGRSRERIKSALWLMGIK